MYTSSEFEPKPKSYPQTRSKMTERVSTARRRIKLQVGETQDLDRLVGRAPKQRADARKQLDEREGLDDVVVRAGVQSRDPVAHLVARGQHQHGQLAAGPPQPPADLEPVHVRHQDIEDDEIRPVAVRLEALERFGAVRRQLHVVALEPQRAAERLAHRRIVVHDQDLHAHIVAPECEGTLRDSGKS